MEKKSVFKNKNYLLLFQGTLTSNIAATFYSFALSFYILDITNNNAFMQGLYLAVLGITFVLFSFVGGVLADRWDKVKIIYYSDFIKGFLIIISVIPMYLYIKSGNNSMQLFVIFIIGILSNIIAAIFNPTSSALIPQIVAEELYQQANSYFSMLTSLISIVGIIVAGLFYSLLPIIILFLIVGILYILSGISELFIKVEHERSNNLLTIKSIVNDFKEGLSVLWNLKPIFYIIFGSLFLNFFFTPLSSNLLPYIFKTDIANSNYLFKDHLTPEMWMSITSAAFGIGSLIMAFILSSTKQKEKQGRTIKLSLVILVTLITLLTTTYILFIENNVNVFLITFTIIIFLIGIVIIRLNIPVSIAIQKNIPKDMMAKVSSVMSIGSMGLTPFAALLGGLIISLLGSSLLFVLITIGLAIVTILMVLSKEISRI